MSSAWCGANISPRGLPWWLRGGLTATEGIVMVRCVAMVAAVLADELELPPGALPTLLRAAIDDYGRTDVAPGVESGLRSLYEAVRIAFG